MAYNLINYRYIPLIIPLTIYIYITYKPNSDIGQTIFLTILRKKDTSKVRRHLSLRANDRCPGVWPVSSGLQVSNGVVDWWLTLKKLEPVIFIYLFIYTIFFLSEWESNQFLSEWESNQFKQFLKGWQNEAFAHWENGLWYCHFTSEYGSWSISQLY